MSSISASAEREIAAPDERVYRTLADYQQHHPRILPDAFSGFRVEQGGIGTGTVIHFEVTVGGRTESYHQRIEETVPGRVLREVDFDGSRATTFTVTPAGDRCHVRIETNRHTGGIRGLVERLVAPRLRRPLYEDELDRLDRYAREHSDEA
ncbi:MAG TPA: SRPBCC family protein [Thermomicrobiales bacterium]|nr:SRPBCC family protein [Thermomicrobiales bacterium]